MKHHETDTEKLKTGRAHKSLKHVIVAATVGAVIAGASTTAAAARIPEPIGGSSAQKEFATPPATKARKFKLVGVLAGLTSPSAVAHKRAQLERAGL